MFCAVCKYIYIRHLDKTGREKTRTRLNHDLVFLLICSFFVSQRPESAISDSSTASSRRERRRFRSREAQAALAEEKATAGDISLSVRPGKRDKSSKRKSALNSVDLPGKFNIFRVLVDSKCVDHIYGGSRFRRTRKASACVPTEAFPKYFRGLSQFQVK